MKSWWFVGMLLVGLASTLTGCKVGRQATSAPSSGGSTPIPTADEPIRYQSYSLPQSTIHLLVIPAQQRFRVVPALSSSVDTVAHLAEKQGAIAAINGGFFDPSNQKTTSTVIIQGRMVADPNQNERLTGNPTLSPYLPQILNRSELRRYQCGPTVRYTITQATRPLPSANGHSNPHFCITP